MKVAIVTGAGSGIGLAIAENLATNGYKVVLGDINKETLDVAVAGLKAKKLDVEAVAFDATNEDDVNKAITSIGEKHGKIDAVINGAGGLGGRSRFEGMETSFYRKVMALNLDSAFFVTRAAIPFLKKGVTPSVINFASNAAWNAGGPGAGIYGTSKGAIVLLTRAMAKDLAEFGIRVNAVSPGTIDTPFHDATKKNNPAMFESWKNNILMKRFGQASEVATVIEFLLSDKASFITGEVIQINGGQDLL